MNNKLPCGCKRTSIAVTRKLRAKHLNWLLPSLFVYCNCDICGKNWVERYEFSFNIPINNLPIEDQEA